MHARFEHRFGMAERGFHPARHIDKDVRVCGHQIREIRGEHIRPIALVDIFIRISHHDFDDFKLVCMGGGAAEHAAANNAQTHHCNTKFTRRWRRFHMACFRPNMCVGWQAGCADAKWNFLFARKPQGARRDERSRNLGGFLPRNLFKSGSVGIGIWIDLINAVHIFEQNSLNAELVSHI